MSQPLIQPPASDHLRLLQINLNKSEAAQLELINDELSNNYDIILIQEPHTTTFGNIRTPNQFRQVYPGGRQDPNTKVRSGIWVNRNIDTGCWKELPIPDTGDITAIQLTGKYGRLSIFNIYNPCENNSAEVKLHQYLQTRGPDIHMGATDHMIWAGDFNRHHPLWDRAEDVHLFTRAATNAADQLIELLGTYGMVMALPKDLPTLRHMVTKKLSRPDNVFCTENLSDLFTICEVDYDHQPTKTDHYPIKSTIELTHNLAPSSPAYNFRMADWDDFNKNLEARISDIRAPRHLLTREEFEEATMALTEVIQDTIRTRIKLRPPIPNKKRWWTSEVEAAKRSKNKAGSLSRQYRAIPEHPAHQQFKEARDSFAKLMIRTKREDWSEWLLEAGTQDLWTANQYMRDPVGDGGRPRIPSLTVTDEYGEQVEITGNEEKARLFANAFFPSRPETSSVPRDFNYPDPLPDPESISRSQIEHHIRKLAPYKACGIDEIPNIVLQKSLTVILDHLYFIFKATFDLGVYPDEWKQSITAVLRKPGKPNYKVAKAYRPIALLNTIPKVLTSIVAENISHLVEEHNLLPKTHFGGRPGRTTGDAVHYLVHKIKDAWRRGKVVSILFLDVEGAFPNAVTDRLIHNLRKRKIPKVYVDFIERLLTNRKTKLRFDDFMSEFINIDNGIGQGDPLSMILYIIYNADLLELVDLEDDEDAVGYVDDATILAIGDDLDDTTDKLHLIMHDEGGGLTWSEEHNSRFEVSKLAVMHATRPRQTNEPGSHPRLEINGQLVTEVDSYKYLGVHIDNQLRWDVQLQKATEKATAWVLNFRRLTRPSTGIRARLMRQLYISTVIPKMTYCLDVWYTPPTKPPGGINYRGSVRALKKMTKIQRMATLAITGGMWSTPNDLLDAHAGVLPMELTLRKICHRSIVRTCTLPVTHPLRPIVWKAGATPPKTHLSPIENLVRIFEMNPQRFEIIRPARTPPSYRPPFSTDIADSREESMENERKDKTSIKIFSDGSGFEGSTGAAAVLLREGQLVPTATLTYHLGDAMEHTSYDAEATGGILAMWILKTLNTKPDDKIRVYTDSQALIKAIKFPKAKSGQTLLTEFIALARQIPGRIRLSWISGHTDVPGNEAADAAAKDAARGTSSKKATLPTLLRRRILTSASAEKQAYHEELKGQWVSRWEDSPRKPRFDKIDPDFPFNKFRKVSDQLNRAQSSLLVQASRI